MKRWDVVFIGTGISALTCAAILAKKGKSVCLLEQHSKPGGYLHCFNRFGMRFDTGSHYVGAMEPGQPFHTLLNYLGAYRDDLFVPLESDGFDVFYFPEFEARFAKTYKGSIESLSQTFPADREAITRFFELVEKTVQKFPTYTFNEDYSEADLLGVLDTSLAQVVESLTDNPRLRSVLYGHVVNHGVQPEDISFGLHCLVVDSLIRGPFGFRRGGDALTDQFVRVIKENGGEIFLSTKVTSLITDGKAIKEVQTEKSGTFQAEWIVSSAHPKATFRLLDRELLSPAFRSRLKGIKESVGIFGVYANCSKSAGLDLRRNYFYFESSDPKRLLRIQGPGDKPSVVYLSCTRRMEETSTKHPLTFHAPGPIEWFSGWKETSFGKRTACYKSMKHELGTRVIDFVDGFRPGLKDLITQFDASTPLTNLHYNGSEEGSAYGIYHSIQNTGMRALGPRTHIKNLLLTGQNSLFPGLMGASIAGLRTAGSLVGIKPLIKELRLLGENA
jgi:all-trans-retinol 13,14-reductase